jgi:hypothetical protein
MDQQTATLATFRLFESDKLRWSRTKYTAMVSAERAENVPWGWWNDQGRLNRGLNAWPDLYLRITFLCTGESGAIFSE